MGLFAILLFAFGVLAESRTRQNTYSGVSCIMGGRLAALFVSYIIQLIGRLTIIMFQWFLLFSYIILKQQIAIIALELYNAFFVLIYASSSFLYDSYVYKDYYERHDSQF